MARRFGLIRTSVFASEKFRALETLLARHVYLYILANRHGNSLGLFKLSPAYIADDLEQDIPGGAEEAQAVLMDLVRVGLIEYDEREKLVRIVGYLDQSPITNHKHMKGARRELAALPKKSPLLPATAADVVHSAWLLGSSLMKTAAQKKQSSSVAAQASAKRNMETAVEIFEEIAEIRSLLHDPEKMDFIIKSMGHRYSDKLLSVAHNGARGTFQ